MHRCDCAWQSCLNFAPQVFVGKAQVLHEELSKHFDQFEKKRRLIKAIDDELCHHTSIAGWDLVVWPLQVCYVSVVKYSRSVTSNASYGGNAS